MDGIWPMSRANPNRQDMSGRIIRREAQRANRDLFCLQASRGDHEKTPDPFDFLRNQEGRMSLLISLYTRGRCCDHRLNLPLPSFNDHPKVSVKAWEVQIPLSLRLGTSPFNSFLWDISLKNLFPCFLVPLKN